MLTGVLSLRARVGRITLSGRTRERAVSIRHRGFRNTPLGYMVHSIDTPSTGDDERTKDQLMTTNEYRVTGMSCGHCELSVREEVGAVPGVTAVQVSAQTGMLTIDADRDIDDAEILAAVAEAGYQATPAR